MTLYTEKQMCEKLNVGRMFFSRYKKQGLPYHRIGKKLIRYDLEKVMEWLEIEAVNRNRGGEKSVQ